MRNPGHPAGVPLFVVGNGPSVPRFVPIGVSGGSRRRHGRPAGVLGSGATEVDGSTVRTVGRLASVRYQQDEREPHHGDAGKDQEDLRHPET